MSSGVQDRGRNLPVTTQPEVPRRPTITTTASRSMPTPTPVESAVPPTSHSRHHGMPAVREIHKNAWLKRLQTSYDKKGVPITKKAEKWWVVFCVHDDLEAFLEFYTEPKMTVLHKPAGRISLKTCLHVSPSIMGQDNEYEFAVTLPSQVIRLAATDWDQMLEWVESLQGKLREMNVLSPKDNLYSKLPESRICASNHYGLAFGSARLRDPNSPLPPPPASTALTDRISPVHQMTSEYIDTSNQSGQPFLEPRVEPHHTSITVTSDGRPFESLTTASVYVQAATSSGSFLRDGNGSDSGNGSGESHWSIDTTSPQTSAFVPVHSQNDHAISNSFNTESRPSPVGVIIGNHNNSTLVQIGFENPIDDSLLSSTTISSTSDSLSGESSNNDKSTRRSRSRTNSRKFKTDLGLNFQGLKLPVDTPSSSSSYRRQLSAPTEQVTQPSSAESAGSSDNVYEHIFIAVGNSSLETAGRGGDPSRNNSESDTMVEVTFPPLIPKRTPNGKRFHRRVQLHEGLEDGQTSDNSTRSEALSSSAATTRPIANANIQSGSRRIRITDLSPEMRPLEGIIQVINGEYRISSWSQPELEADNHSLAGTGAGSSSARVPLKESQVMRLKKEINHIHGVLITLRKKDCINTISFVDYLGAVWIAGWKQHEHPVLYYAFHVGDQVIKVEGQRVQSSEETRKVIAETETIDVQFIIRRLPYGRVFALKRKVEGEPLGLVAVGNSAEISEVLPKFLASRQGLPSKSMSVDGQSYCNWFLTEINNRPLSLTARENELKDRLNAVGKEISILVQPSDLVKHLKKQLKSMKGFKDYLVV